MVMPSKTEAFMDQLRTFAGFPTICTKKKKLESGYCKVYSSWIIFNSGVKRSLDSMCGHWPIASLWQTLKDIIAQAELIISLTAVDAL